jgi:hypothetical protein
MKLAVIAVSIFISISAHADGLSYLGMCHPTWDCKASLQEWRGEPLGWLENTFGERCQCVDRFLATSQPKTVRVHLINSPCMRNKRCGKYEVLYGETAASASRKIMRGDKRILGKFNAVLERLRQRLSKAKGDVTCYVSPCLECDLYDRARRRLASIVSAALPNCIIVDNPHRHECIRGTVCEFHGEAPRVSAPCIVDLDGTDAKDVDVNKWLAKYRYCDIRFIWTSWMNCLSDRFIDPRKRVCRR